MLQCYFPIRLGVLQLVKIALDQHIHLAVMVVKESLYSITLLTRLCVYHGDDMKMTKFSILTTSVFN